MGNKIFATALIHGKWYELSVEIYRRKKAMGNNVQTVKQCHILVQSTIK